MADGIPSFPVDPMPAPPLLRMMPHKRAPAMAWIWRFAWIALRVATIVLVLWMIRAGIRLRNEIWTDGADLHFFGDIRNTLAQGHAVIREGGQLAGAPAQRPLTWPQFLRGYVHRYDTVYARGRDQQYDLDYTPARLLIAAVWVRHLQADHPNRSDLIDSDLLPLIYLNTGCELASAIAMFLLVRHWRRRADQEVHSHLLEFRLPQGPSVATRSDVPWILGLLAATVLWFNPALITDAHEFPQWDVWLLPFFLGALWLASCESWFVAGSLIAIAAMFKGQILLVAPVLVLLPICSGKLTAALRLIIGALFAGAVMASPWLVNGGAGGGGYLWVAGIITATVALAALSERGNWMRAGLGGWLSAMAIALFVVLPWTQTGRLPPLFLAVPLIVAILGTPWFVRSLTRSGTAVWIAIVATATIGSASDAYAGTWSWFTVGFCFPTWHFIDLAHGLSQNVPALMQHVYGWKLYDHVFTLDLGRPNWHWDISVKVLLSSIYGLTLLACGIAAGIHFRRNDPRVLVALTAPWVLMYAFCPQMHTRYLVWAAAAGSVGWALSVELVLMNLVVTALSTLLILHTLLDYHGGDRSAYPRLFRCLQDAHPGLGWMMALVGAIYLYQAIVPGRKRAGYQHRSEVRSNQIGSIGPIGDGADSGFQGAKIDGLG